MHINLHKTFSTPHGGGGPGAGPTVLSRALAPFAPLPMLMERDRGPILVEHQHEAQSLGLKPLGRMTAFHGQMGMFVRSLAYMMSHGSDGLRRVAEDAVLNANYILAELKDVLNAPFPGTCMHEVVFDESTLSDAGVATMDFAKALIDEGYHPMTMYFPMVVKGAMLVEPTETESKQSLDTFIAAMRGLAEAARRGERERFEEAPRFAPLKRLDETAAARKPRLRWLPPQDDERKAAE